MTQPTRIIAALRTRLNTMGRSWMFGFVPGETGTVKLRYGVIRARGHFKGSLVLTTAQAGADSPTTAAVRNLLDAEAGKVEA